MSMERRAPKALATSTSPYKIFTTINTKTQLPVDWILERRTLDCLGLLGASRGDRFGDQDLGSSTGAENYATGSATVA